MEERGFVKAVDLHDGAIFQQFPKITSEINLTELNDCIYRRVNIPAVVKIKEI